MDGRQLSELIREGTEASVELTQETEIVELRPIETLRVCAACLVSNSAADAFCTACGAALTGVPVAADPELEVAHSREPKDSTSTVVHPQIEPRVTAAQPRKGRTTLVTIALGVATAGLVAFAVLWQIQVSHAHHLATTLDRTRATVASTRMTLAQTQAKLTAATSLSEKRKQVLLQAKDVLAKVDPLLSAVDNIQNKATSLGDQGSSVAYDAEQFIGTVADLVNYMLQTSADYIDYNYVNQAINIANGELGTIRSDEATLSGDNSAYSGASSSFGTKANAFTSSVRALQKQLNGAVGN
jgi:hypothetical protein